MDACRDKQWERRATHEVFDNRCNVETIYCYIYDKSDPNGIKLFRQTTSSLSSPGLP